MPSVSQAQNRFMHAAAEGEVKDVKPSVGKKFVKADEGRKIGHLPQHKGKGGAKKRMRKRAHAMAKRGLISEKAMAKVMGNE